MIFGKYINRYCLRHAPTLLLGIAALILVDYMQLIIPELYRMLINGVNSGQVLVGGVPTAFDKTVLMQNICLPMIGIIVSMVIGRFLWRICFFGAAIRVETELRNRMFDHSKDLSQSYYQVNKVGNLMSLYTNDLETIQECFGDGVLMFCDALFLGLLAFIKMWRMDPSLTLMAMIPAFLMFLVGSIVGRVMTRRWEERQQAFADLSDDMDNAEAMIKYVINRVLERCPQEMEFFNSFVDKGLLERLNHVATSDFGRVTYTEAVEILKKNNDKFDYKVDWGSDLQTEHERYLTEQVFKKPIFVTNYPKEIKAFYMRLDEGGRTVAAADCLVPGIGEIVGGSQREERLDVLEARMAELGLDPADYWWYLDLRRYGSCRHAGYGLGFERLIMYLTGVSNIRDVLPHPRTWGNAEF